MGVTVGGVAASAGIALAVSWQPRGRLDDASAGRLVADAPAVRAAFAAVATELVDLSQRLGAQGLGEEAAIMEAASLIAGDEELLREVLAAVDGGSPAGTAVLVVGEQFATLLEEAGSDYLRERAADVRQVTRRVLDALAGRSHGVPPRSAFVLCDEDVGPVELLTLATEGLAGAISLRGGVNAHAAIVARSLGLPLLLGVDCRRLGLTDGTEVLVDADRALLVVDPSEQLRRDATRRISAATATRQRYALERNLAPETADGQPVVLLCNVASVAEVKIGLAAGAGGVGLLRTELPFLAATEWPDASLQRSHLAAILAPLDDMSVTIRLLDFSNDKVPPFLVDGPFGLEALLADPEALRTQLATVLDAGRRARIQVMLPMVQRPDEVQAVRRELGATARRLDVPVPPLGAMIELPAAVAAAHELAAVADFFSLGTNDLTSAVLGLDRVDRGLRPALAADPRVLSLVAETVRAAAGAGIPLSVCGDAAADPLVLPLLVGAGVRTLSVSPARIDEMRWRLRRTDAAGWSACLHEVLRLPDAEAVWAYVERSGPQ